MIQGDGHVDQHPKKYKAARSTRICINITLHSPSELQNRKETMLWSQKKSHSEYFKWSKYSSLEAICLHLCKHIPKLRPGWMQSQMAGDIQIQYDRSNFIMNHSEIQPSFLNDIIPTDDACCWRSTIYNKQNMHFWSLDNCRCINKVHQQTCW